MAIADGNRVDAGSLGELTIIGSGGQGTVYAVADRMIDNSRPAVYKELRAALNESALLAMARFRRDLAAADARRLDEVTAWPVAVVERHGRIRGFLMRRVPDPFVIGLRVSRGPVEHLAQVQLLLNDEAYLTGRGLIVDDRFRLDLLADIARSMEFLHGLGIVIGDLSPNNLLFSRDHRPRCFFIDCDSMRLRGAVALQPAETVDWQAPPGDRRLATPATDSYKFALLCIRLFAGDQSTRDPDTLDGPLLAPAVLALSTDPRRRPTMADWRAMLEAATVSRPAAPRAPLPRTVPRPPKRQRMTVVVAAILLAVLLCLTLRLAGFSSWVQGLGDTVTGGRATEQASGVAQVIESAGRGNDSVAAAIGRVEACTGVRAAGGVLRTAAELRGVALERAQRLRTDLLTNGQLLEAELVKAYEHDRNADDAFARWAAAVGRDGCPSAAMRGPDRRTGEAEAAMASAAKKRVAELWNPLAAQYGYPAVSAQNI